MFILIITIISIALLAALALATLYFGGKRDIKADFQAAEDKAKADVLGAEATVEHAVDKVKRDLTVLP